MNTHSLPSLEARLQKLESQRRRERLFYVAGIAALIILFISTGAIRSGQPAGTVLYPDSTSVIRARGLIIQDANGVDRIILGSPMPDAKDGKRANEQTGIVINDGKGWERFGLGIDAKGSMAMGFDAPPGQGDPRNRERINIVADEYGGATLRFLNRKTQVVGFMQVDGEDNFYLEYVDWSTGKVLRRKISFAGDETVEWK